LEIRKKEREERQKNLGNTESFFSEKQSQKVTQGILCLKDNYIAPP
jgi:hypothetical protein